MRITKIFLFFLCFHQLAVAQNHTPVLSDLSGEELRNKLVEDFKPATVLNSSGAKDFLYGYVENRNDSVRCVYSGHTLYLPPNVDPSVAMYMNNSPDGINLEHTYPRSKGAGGGNAVSDLHHLFPTRIPVNESRGNFPFGEIADNQTTNWFLGNQTQSNPPNTNIDAYSEQINGKFEPREDHKGNVARAMFYFYTMYESEALAADANFFESQREILCEWHNLDPVDQAEWERTYRVAESQSNLPNPFILDCSLANRTYCPNTPCSISTNTMEEEVTAINIYPNPVTDVVRIEADGDLQIQVFDSIGKLFYENTALNTTVIDFSSFPKNVYFISVNNQVYKVVK
ncbi:MAG: endonuclease [Saprospiraceae bacterium]